MERERISWHPAFLEALQLELESYLDFLDFEAEHQLTSEPLKIDIVIIKKKQDIVIENPIASIFRKFNIFEYKSPTDYVSVDDFYKVYAYACLYKSFNKIDIKDITISFVETKYPKALIKHLKDVKGYKVVKRASGIYDVLGDVVAIQIIESKRLSKKNNVYLRFLNSNLDKESISFVMNTVKQEHKRNVRAYLEVILQANAGVLRGVSEMGKKQLEEVLEEIGLFAEREARAKIENSKVIARNLMKIGLGIEKIAETTGLDIVTVESLYNEMRI